MVRHLNMHEAARLEGGGPLVAPPSQGSLHALLQKPIYDFYVAQLRSLPDTSSRVNGLIRLTAFYLQPWTVHALAPTAATTKGGTAAAAAAAASASVAAAASAASPPPALGGTGGGGSSHLAAAGGNPEHWAYASFVQANFLLYARLLRTVDHPHPHPHPRPRPSRPNPSRPSPTPSPNSTPSPNPSPNPNPNPNPNQVASETRASRFLLSDKTDMAMLLGVCNL